MNEPGPVSSEEQQVSRLVFVSYATADRKQALSVCNALERRGTQCWISSRDVAPGENYQEEIVRAIRDSRAMVLVFSEAANNSDEIKKELSLASRYHVPVMALRIEDVEPSDAFAYELSTRQWIDAFEGWDKSIDSLVQHIDRTASPCLPKPQARTGKPHRTASAPRPIILVSAAALLFMLIAVAAAWWFLRPPAAAAHSMMVRLTGFSNLSTGLPPGMPDAIRDEIIAAFNDDGVVGISTAPAPPPGTAPAYALGGTVRQDGGTIKVNVRLTDERSGATLWSNIFSYHNDDAARVPRHVAVEAGNLIRCGLFGASTYPKALPDPVLTDYLSFCHNSGEIQLVPGKALDLAHKVVAAAPDFSWGWSAVSVAAVSNIPPDFVGPRADQFRKEAAEAADKAISLDKSNSEAMLVKALLVDPRDFVTQEKRFKAALAARPLACGCEHHEYGTMLQAVGRISDAAEEYRRSTDVLALNSSSQLALADALFIQGKTDEAKTHIDAAVDLTSDPQARDNYLVYEAPATGDYAAASRAISNPEVQLPGPLKAALQAGYKAMISGDPAAKRSAVQVLIRLPPEMQRHNVTTLLGALGANRQALQVVANKIARREPGATAWLFLPSMRAALRDPAFRVLAQQAGLIAYWKTTHTKPDVCSDKDPPPFCRMI